MKSILEWLKFLNPSNILLIKKIVDAVEALIRLLEELFANPRDIDNNDKHRSP